MPGKWFHRFCPCAVMLLAVACSAPGEAKRPDPFRRATAVVAGASRGVSGSAIDNEGQLWAVEERAHELLRLRRPQPGGIWQIEQRLPLRGLPEERTDAEALAWMGPNRFAVGTEGLKEGRPSDAIYWIDLRDGAAVVTGSIDLPYALWGLTGERNRGVEGLCASGEWLVAAVEQVLTREGRREAPLALWHVPSARWFPYRVALTTTTGKISSLDCRLTAEGLEMVAIERHYSVGELLRFTIAVPQAPASTPPLIVPTAVTSLFEDGSSQPNYEGVTWHSDTELTFISDNDTGGVSGPTLVLQLQPLVPAQSPSAQHP